MSEQRAPPKTSTQPADASPKRKEREPALPNFEDLLREEAVEQRVGVQGKGDTGRVMQKRLRPAEKGGEAKKPAAKQSKKASSDGGGGGKVEQRQKPVGVGGDGGGGGKVERGEKAVGVGGNGGGAAEGNGQGREVAVPPPAVAPTADAPPAVAPPAASQDASTQANLPDQAAMEENLALQARLAAFAANSEQHAAVRDALTRQLALNEREKEDLRHAAAQATAEAAAAQQAYGRLKAAGDEEVRRQAEVLRVADEARAEAERQRETAIRVAGEAQAAAQRQLDEERQAMQQQLQNAMAEARDLTNQRDAALLELRDTARSPEPNAGLHEGGVAPGGGEELPRMSSRDASYAAAVANSQIPNAIGPLARVIETDPRWGTGRREDFEDTPNIESIERRRYNRSAGNILYEQNFPIGQFASVRVPMPRGTPQTLALFGRNAHVATPAQSFNRAIMRYEGRGVYR